MFPIEQCSLNWIFEACFDPVTLIQVAIIKQKMFGGGGAVGVATSPGVIMGSHIHSFVLWTQMIIGNMK